MTSPRVFAVLCLALAILFFAGALVSDTIGLRMNARIGYALCVLSLAAFAVHIWLILVIS